MSQIINFPIPENQKKHGSDAEIEEILAIVPDKSREKLRFELIKTIDSYDAYFTQWSLSFPEGCDETLKKQIYDLAHQEHGRKMRMLRDIMVLKAKELVSEYYKFK